MVLTANIAKVAYHAQSLHLVGDNQQAITAIEQVQSTQQQLEALLNQNPPNVDAINSCYNKLSAQWNAFTQIQVNDPYGIIKLDTSLAALCLDNTGLSIDTGDFGTAAQSCNTFGTNVDDILTELQFSK